MHIDNKYQFFVVILAESIDFKLVSMSRQLLFIIWFRYNELDYIILLIEYNSSYCHRKKLYFKAVSFKSSLWWIIAT